MNKSEVRDFIRQKKRQMTLDEISNKSAKIIERFYQEPCFLDADALYCYVSYNQEVQTRQLIADACLQGKSVAVPKVIGKDMEFFYIHSLDDLKKGYQGILEPVTTRIASESKACLIMPGLAFDTSKNRVGYGGGFYDRYLEKHTDTIFTKVAFAYEYQIVSTIEVDSFDQKVDFIITPDDVL